MAIRIRPPVGAAPSAGPGFGPAEAAPEPVRQRPRRRAGGAWRAGPSTATAPTRGRPRPAPAPKPCRRRQLVTPSGLLSFISTTTVFGTPVDVTLQELAVEAFFPADAQTTAALSALHG